MSPSEKLSVLTYSINVLQLLVVVWLDVFSFDDPTYHMKLKIHIHMNKRHLHIKYLLDIWLSRTFHGIRRSCTLEDPELHLSSCLQVTLYSFYNYSDHYNPLNKYKKLILSTKLSSDFIWKKMFPFDFTHNNQQLQIPTKPRAQLLMLSTVFVSFYFN